MTILDVAIVNVAIPSIQLKLHTTPATVQWVLIAYSITFGGFLLLGGRMADLLGRRLIFLVGLTLFTVASLVCGLAGSIAILIAARAVQGVGAAIISPAALSIVSTTFEEGADRNKALGIWGALGGSRRRCRCSLRRDPDQVPRLGVDLLRQRPSRRAGLRADADLRSGEPRRHARPPLRRRRGGDRHRQVGAPGLRDLEGPGRRLGLRANDPAADRLWGHPGRLRADRSYAARAP